MKMMEDCMKKCRWCPLIPVIFGIILFLVGYFLRADIVRIVWLTLSGLVILLGLLCLIMMGLMGGKKK